MRNDILTELLQTLGQPEGAHLGIFTIDQNRRALNKIEFLKFSTKDRY